MSYFSGFPFVVYKFGTESVLTSFQDISAYVEVIDQIKDNVSFYSLVTIADNERPDTLSQRLYGTPTLYWTFYLMNDKIREQGWPLNNQELEAYIRKFYPLTTIITRDSLTGVMLPGQTIEGLLSGAAAVIKSRRLDFGQLNIEVTSGTFQQGELIQSTVDEEVQTVQVQSIVEQFNAIQRWQDSDGAPVDVDPTVGTSGFDTPVTFYERMVEQNDQLKTIRVIKPSAIASVRAAFKDALNR